MFYIYVKIYSRSQMNLIEPDFMSNLENKLSIIHKESGGTSCQGVEDLFRYAAFYRETFLKVIKAAQRSMILLDSFQDEMDGFNIIVTRTEKKEYDLSKKIEHLSHQILDNGGIWIDPDCFDELTNFIVMDKEYYLYRMVDLKKIDPLLNERFFLFFLNKSYQNEILQWFQSESSNMLLLKGEEGTGRLVNLNHVLEVHYPVNDILILKAKKDMDYIYDPFISSLDHDDLIGMKYDQGDFLFELTMGHMMQRCSDFFSIDFEMAYLDYIDKKIMASTNISAPIILLIQGIENFSSISKGLLTKIFLRYKDSRDIRFVIIGQEDNYEFIPSEYKAENISFYSVTKRRALEQLSEAYPDELWSEDKLIQLKEYTDFIPSKLFHGALVLSQGGILSDGKEPVERLIELLSTTEKQLLAHIFIGDGMLHQEELSRLLMEQYDDESLILEQLNRLCSMGLIRINSNAVIEPCFTRMDLELGVETKIVNEFAHINKLNGDLNEFRYFSFLEKYGMVDEALVHLNIIMNWLINNGFKDRAEAIIQNPPFGGLEISSTTLESLQNLLYSNRLRLALQEGDREKLEELISNGLLSLVSERGKFAEDFYIQLSRYHYCQGNMEQTINYAKDALYSFQKKGNHLGESLANIELAFAFLGQRKVQMAMDYFEIARRISYQIEDNYTLITSHTFGALSSFLFGNISKAETMIEQVLPLAVKNGSQRRIFFLTFLLGRIRFEYGHYKEAAEMFENCAELGERIGLEEGFLTARRWTGRCLLYLEKRREAFKWLNSEDSSREGLFFLAESDFMVSLFESALRRLDEARTGINHSDISYSERDVWCDGFMPFEGRFSSHEQPEDVLTYQIEALNSHILALTGRQDEALQFFSRLSNHGDFPFKPYSYKYSYIHFAILNMSEIPLSGDDRRLASLSRAIERLQSRAGRFDNQRKKLDFLNKNWWNSKIIQEAHQKKFL